MNFKDMKPVPTLSVADLIKQLEKIQNKNLKVTVWLPGSYIDLACVFMKGQGSEVFIEGNLRPGSALYAD